MTEINRKNTDTLLIVSIFHYVLFGFQMLLSLVGFIYIFVGVLFSTNALEPSKGSVPPEQMGWVFIAFGAVFVFVLLVMSFLTLKTGINIAKRKHRTFCIVIDSILCLWVPFGTIVGIFGLVYLTKSEIVLEFDS